MLKRISLYCLIAVLFVQSIALGIYAVQKKYNYKSRFASNKPMQTIALSKAQFSKVIFIEKDEMLMEHTMYDILSIEKNGEMVNIKCIKDTEDTNLAKAQKQHQDKQYNQLKYTVQLYCAPLVDFDFTQKQLPVFTEHLAYYNWGVKRIYLDKQTPPPNCL